MAALGSDTGGSIRNPAALCGLIGLKPTYGLISRSGVYTNSFSYDTAGPMTWSVEDCAILLNTIAGHDPKDPASAPRRVPNHRAMLPGGIKGMRIGVTSPGSSTHFMAAFLMVRNGLKPDDASFIGTGATSQILLAASAISFRVTSATSGTPKPAFVTPAPLM